MNNKKLFFGLWILLFVLILFAYRNHFDNEFHFDDGHTIQSNMYIQSLRNIPDFFTVGAPTFSSLPANQLYRPVVSTTLAVDYWLSTKFDPNGSGFNTFYYHLSMFLEYLIMLVFIYLLAFRIFQKVKFSENNKWFALGLAAWYGIHVTNGETLNYIISRSDLLSTLFVLISFVIFIDFPKIRRYGLFLIPFVLGLLTKQTAAVFTPILIVYFFFFEMDDYLISSSNVERKNKIAKLGLQTILLFVFTAIVIYFVLSKQGESYTPGGSSVFLYLITQPFVIFHYFISFFFPYLLSADTDWGLLNSIWDIRFFIGTIFIITMLWIAYKTYFKKEMRPISFGILWFFIALAPTSSIIPLSEVMNDHRMMYPFVGLIISVVWSLVLLFNKFENIIKTSFMAKNLIVAFFSIIFIFHFFAVMQRVEVWDNGKTLWYDVTVKSPKNGRGLMNYGLQLAAEGKYDQALVYYKRALNLMPYYSYLYTNLGIAYNAMDSVQTAEWHYKRSIELSPQMHNGYYYYAIFLRSKSRIPEAEANFKKVLEFSPDYIYARYALLEIFYNDNRWNELNALLSETEAKFPYDKTIMYYKTLAAGQKSNFDKLKAEAWQNKDVGKLLELSLIYYRQNQFDSCVSVGKAILTIDSKNAAAYNNLIAALNNIGDYDQALQYGLKAIEMAPDDKLLRNNIEVSKKRKILIQKLSTINTAPALISLSLEFYYESMFKECVAACEKSLKISPENPTAYNNICSAYNALSEWKLAEKAGLMAVKLDPNSQLAKNNLAISQKNLNR
jgi:protein O-mannosyl-transferase